MELSAQDGKRAFAHWLRSGLWPTVRLADGTELKFNPYHDPRNGQFTFAPGGAGGAGGVRLAPGGQGRTMGRGGNSRAFEDPMTLESVFPGLRQMPGGAIVAVADNFLNFTGPANEAQAALTENWAKQIRAQIKTVDPKWYYPRFKPAGTLQGRIDELNDLRWYRAAVLLRVKGDAGPMKIETLRFVQENTDRAYDQGFALLKGGKLKMRLSDREALGNYIDREVRNSLREQYTRFNIDSAGRGPIRVNRREDDTSGTDATYRRPDARVDDLAFDVTLTQKKRSKPRRFAGFSTRISSRATSSSSGRVRSVKVRHISFLDRRRSDDGAGAKSLS